MMFFWMIVTRCADTLVLLPIAAVCLAWFLCGRAWRMALWWCALFGLGLMLVVASKVAFIGWGIGIQALDFTGFSGHAMRATAVLPVVFYLAAERATPQIRCTALLLGLMLGGMVGYSRLVLLVHSVSEVLAGCVLGGVVALGFIWQAHPLSQPVRYRGLIVLVLASLVLTPVLLTEPAPTEHWLQKISLALSGHPQPFTRAMWHSTSPAP